jgi:hypothetical protein
MSLEQFIFTLITSSVSTTVILIVAGFISRSIIERWFIKDLEKYKIEIQATNDIEVEKIKMALDVEKFKSETQYSKFHERRAEVIDTFYKKLVRLSRHSTNMRNELADKKAKGILLTIERDIENSDSWEDAYNYFEENKIYFSTKIALRLSKHLIQAHSLHLLFIASTNSQIIDDFSKDYKTAIETARQGDPLNVAEKLLTDIYEDKKLIEAEFRELIGVME